MLLDYELAISCALAAVAILRIIDRRRRLLRLRDRLPSVRTGVDPSHDAAATKQVGALASHDLHDERMENLATVWPCSCCSLHCSGLVAESGWKLRFVGQENQPPGSVAFSHPPDHRSTWTWDGER